MNRNRPWVTWLSVLLSIIVHGMVLAPLADLPIGKPGGRVFGRTPDDQPFVPVERAEDVIINPGESLDRLAVDDQADADRAAQVRREADRLIEQADPAALGDAGSAPSPQPRDIDPTTAAPPADAGELAIGDAALDRADARLLAAADPAITPPRFHAATDGVVVPQPTTEPISPGDLAALMMGGARVGQPGGPAGGGSAGPAPGSGGVAPGFVPRLRDDMPAPAPPPVIDVPAVDIDLTPPTDPQPTTQRLDDDFSYQLLTYHGPPRRHNGIRLFGSGPTAPAKGWFEVRITARPALRRLRPLGKDVVYVIDTSGSIKDDWLQPIRKGVIAALGSLNPGDRFNIVRFEDTVAVMSPTGLLDATAAQVRAAEQFVNNTREGGSTDVDRALASLVRRRVDPGRVYQVIFISDGKPTQGAIDASTIIDAFTRDNRMVAAIYFVAVGRSINRPLIDSLAYRNKGYAVRPARAADAAGAIRDLASRLRYPILRDAEFSIAGTDRSAVFPRQLRDVYQGDPVRLFGRFDATDQRIGGEVFGRNHGDPMAFRFNLPFDGATLGQLPIATAWAREKVAHLTSQMLGQDAYQAEQTEAQIKALRKEYDLEDG